MAVSSRRRALRLAAACLVLPVARPLGAPPVAPTGRCGAAAVYDAARPLTPAWLALLLVCAAAVVGAQDGPPPFAVPVEPVSFANVTVRLAGGFLKPEGSGPFPAVVLVHGAGPATAAEPAFRVHANAFVRGGFAVLVYDKRGSGQSTGVLSTSDYDDLAADIEAGVRLLRTRPDVAPDEIGVLGRSEGGWTGALAASRDPKIAFVIMSSGSAIRPSEQTMYATERALQAAGASPQEAKSGTEAKAALWAYYRRVARDFPWAQTAAGRGARDAIHRQAPVVRTLRGGGPADCRGSGDDVAGVLPGLRPEDRLRPWSRVSLGPRPDPRGHRRERRGRRTGEHDSHLRSTAG